MPDETRRTGTRRPRCHARPLTEISTVDALIRRGDHGTDHRDLLAKAGRSVAVLERGRCALADTGHTSAHLTMVTDARLASWSNASARLHAQATWDARLAAIAHVEESCSRAGSTPTSLASPATCMRRRRRRRCVRARLDARCGGRAAVGFDVELLDEVPLIGTTGNPLRNPGPHPSPGSIWPVSRTPSSRPVVGSSSTPTWLSRQMTSSRNSQRIYRALC